LQYIVDTLVTVPGVRAQIYYRTIGNEVPYLALSWDERAFKFTQQDCVEALRAGDPQIAVTGSEYREVVQPLAAPPFKELHRPGEPPRLFAIASNTLKPCEEKIVAQRLKEILAPLAKRT
jgi:hypothetical protein